MRIDGNTRLWLRLNQALFVVLFTTAIGLLGWLSTRHYLESDWTAAGSNSLSAASVRLLARLDQPLRITAFAREDRVLRRAIEEMVDRYRRIKPDTALEFVNPDQAPDRVRELGISVDGELLIEYGERSARARETGEQAITNAVLRAAQAGERWVAYLAGHGERDLLGTANHDLGQLGEHLQRRGYRVQAVNLPRAGAVPDNTAVLVVTEPAVALLPAEMDALVRHVEAGGNLLWLADPAPIAGMERLAEALGIRFAAGTVVEPMTLQYDIDDPSLALVTDYPPHPATGDFRLMSLFPRAAAVVVEPRTGWTAAALARSGPGAWLESGPLEGEIVHDEGREPAGPIDLGVALVRDRPAVADGAPRARQRVVVFGDGDFLSNAYLGNGGNLDLGMSIVHWLAENDRLVDVPARTAPDPNLQLTRFAAGAIALGSLFGLPLLFAGVGTAVWRRRRHR